jgi:polyribonucleotide nucleotidyltransferase
VINGIIEETGVKIDIDDSGLVMISSVDPKGMAEAVKRVEDITREAEVGKIYHGKVTRIMDFGAFVEIFPGHEGLVHISELAPFRVNRVEDILKEGDETDVIVTEIDEQGRTNLSKKLADLKLGRPAPKPPQGSFASRPGPTRFNGGPLRRSKPGRGFFRRRPER